MTKNASMKAQRGTKRTCHNEECGSRFYDLNREPIVCPVCNTTYEHAPAPAPVTVKTYQRPVKKRPCEVADDVKPVAAAEGEELVAIDGEEETVAPAQDESIIEVEEEDSTDVSGIIDAPIDPDEKN
jgi:uncharacterized protein (TIGR02300 family)